MRSPFLLTLLCCVLGWGQSDPVLKLSREVARADYLFVATDHNDDIIAVGRLNDDNYPVTQGALQSRFGGGTCVSRLAYPCYDVVIAKFRAFDGQLIAATYFGGNGEDLPTAMTVDEQGYIYIAGTTTSRNFPRTTGAVQTEFRSNSSTAFVAKIHNSLAAAEFSTYLGGTAPTYIRAIAADRAGNALVTGTTSSTNFPTTQGAYRATGTAGMAFYSRITNGGRTLIASTYLATGTPVAIVADTNSDAVIVGNVGGDWPVTNDAFQRTRAGGADLFLTRVQGLGTGLRYSTFIGGPANDEATDIVMANDGSLAISGVTYSGRFPGTTETLGEVGTGFVMKFRDSVEWTRPIRANGLTSVSELQLDGMGFLIATGTTNSTHFPATPGAHHRCLPFSAQSQPAGFYARLSPSGDVQYATLVHENLSTNNWATVLRTGGDVVTLNRPASAAENLPPSRLRRYLFQPTSDARLECVVSAASYRNQGIAAGMIVTLFGNGLGPAEGVVATISEGRLPTTLGGARVLINGVEAPLLYARADQINAVVPFRLLGSPTAEVRVEHGGATAGPLSLPLRNIDAGVFRLGSTEHGAILNQDGTVNSPQNPAARGSIVTFWATGLGAFESGYDDGSIVGGNISPLRTPIRVYLGEAEAQVLYSGSSPDMVAGATQFNVRLATNTRVSSRVPITITTADTSQSELAYVSVR